MLQYLYSETTIAIHKRKREDWVSRLKKIKMKDCKEEKWHARIIMKGAVKGAIIIHK